MIINQNTSIATLVNANKESVEAIASLSKPLEKLKNPVLRKIMASRVSIAEAAKMGGVTIDDFARVLAPLGFDFEESLHQEKQKTLQQNKKPEWLQNAAKQDITWFDVRPLIDGGTDPLKEILHQFKIVKDGKILCIINSFIPTPLINLLRQNKAEDSFTELVSEKEYYVYFLKGKKERESVETGTGNVIMDDASSFQNTRRKFNQQQTREIDVRAMEMPLPMQTILAELETLPNGTALLVHHKRVPVYLLEELSGRDLEIHIFNMDDSNVKILLFNKDL